MVSNGVAWFSLKQFNIAKQEPNIFLNLASEYCTISRPLHFRGPLSEKVPKNKSPFSATELETKF
jgi:hypothetical protein